MNFALESFQIHGVTGKKKLLGTTENHFTKENSTTETLCQWVLYCLCCVQIRKSSEKFDKKLISTAKTMHAFSETFFFGNQAYPGISAMTNIRTGNTCFGFQMLILYEQARCLHRSSKNATFPPLGTTSSADNFFQLSKTYNFETYFLCLVDYTPCTISAGAIRFIVTKTCVHGCHFDVL